MNANIKKGMDTNVAVEAKGSLFWRAIINATIINIKAIKRVLSCHPLKILGGGQGYDPVIKEAKVKK